MSSRFLLFIFFSVCWLPAKSQISNNPYLPTVFPDRIILNVTEDPSTSMAVNWRTSDSLNESYAEIALAAADPRFVDKAKKIKATSQRLTFHDTPTATYHAVIFQGLLPNTKYAYRVGQGEIWSEWIHFNTAGKMARGFLSFILVMSKQISGLCGHALPAKLMQKRQMPG